MAARRYAALVYCARSGSTFLAHRIDEGARRIAVIPEFRLPLLLFWKGEAAVRALEAAAMRDLFREDPQIGNLGLSEAALDGLAAELAGRGIRGAVDGLVAARLRMLGAEDRDLILLKNSEFVQNADLALAAFPELRFIHVRRDPRGVASSMIRTVQPDDDGRAMARGDAIHAARIWTRYMRLAGALEAQAPVLNVDYARLVAAPEETAARVRRWLGDDGAEGAGGLFEVGAAERGMHRLAAGGAAAERAEAWRAEMPPWLIAAVETVADEEMDRLGLARLHPRRPLSLRARLHHGARTAGHYLSAARRWSGWIFTDPRRARVRLRSFAMRLRGRG